MILTTIVANKPTTPWIPRLEALESNLLFLISDYLLPHEFKNPGLVCKRFSKIFTQNSQYWKIFATRMNIKPTITKDENGVERANYEKAIKTHYGYFIYNVYSVASHPGHTPLLEEIKEIKVEEMLHGKMATTLKYQRLLSVLQRDPVVYESYLCWAARENLEEEVRILLTVCRLSQAGREKALQSAIENDSPSTMKVLLYDGPVSNPMREACILALASLNEFAMLELFISKATLSQETVDQGVKIGANLLEIKTVQAFVKTNRLSKRGTEKALLACIKSVATDYKGAQVCINITNLILQSGDLSKEARGKAVIAATEYPHDMQAHLLEFLLSKAEVDDEDLGEAVVRAAKYGQLGALHILVRNRFISHENWNRAYRGAITNRRLEVKAFLERNRF